MMSEINPGLAALSLLVAVMSVYTALDLSARLRAASPGTAIGWLLGGALHLGGGLWAMHQIGLIAMAAQAPIALDGRLLLGSLFLAVGISGFALYRVGRATLSTRGLFPAAFAVGVGVSAMHLCGVAALVSFETPSPSIWTVMGAVLIASVAALAGLRTGLSSPELSSDMAFGRRLLGALAIGGALFAQHHISFSSLQWVPSVRTLPSAAWLVELSELALAVALVILVLLCISLMVSRTNERQAQSRQRLLLQLKASNQELAAEVQVRKRMQRHLLDSEARFRAAFEDAAIGMALLRPDGQWLKMNSVLLTMLGGTLRDWQARGLPQAVPEEQRPALASEMQRLRTHEARMEGLELQLQKMNGERHWVRLHLALVSDELGSPNYFVAQIHDISERHQLEAELKRSNQELEHFAYAASHDLQAPLRGISGFAKLLQRRYADQLDDDGKEYLQLMLDSTRSMNDLIQGLLELGRVGRGGIECHDVALQGPLDDARQRLSSLISDRAADLRFPAELPSVHGDAKLLAQLFQNLISNAIKFQPGTAPRVELEVSVCNDLVRMDFRDHGIGIEPRHFERIFRIFQRLHTEDEYQGSGIGLSICEKIVRLHGGRIELESVPGSGSCFSVVLPNSNTVPRT